MGGSCVKCQHKSTEQSGFIKSYSYLQLRTTNFLSFSFFNYLLLIKTFQFVCFFFLRSRINFKTFLFICYCFYLSYSLSFLFLLKWKSLLPNIGADKLVSDGFTYHKNKTMKESKYWDTPSRALRILNYGRNVQNCSEHIYTTVYDSLVAPTVELYDWCTVPVHLHETKKTASAMTQ